MMPTRHTTRPRVQEERGGATPRAAPAVRRAARPARLGAPRPHLRPPPWREAYPWAYHHACCVRAAQGAVAGATPHPQRRRRLLHGCSRVADLGRLRAKVWARARVRVQVRVRVRARARARVRARCTPRHARRARPPPSARARTRRRPDPATQGRARAATPQRPPTRRRRYLRRAGG